jgi:predicted DNA-binding transcriptional regulator AlpA
VLRKAMRKKAVLEATGLPNSTLYEQIAKGHFPKGTKLDPDGRNVIWWEDEVIAWQAGVMARNAATAA